MSTDQGSAPAAFAVPAPIDRTRTLEAGMLGDIDPSFTVESVYEIGKELGKGNFSTVYEGKSKATGEQCAIKVIKKTKLSSSKHIQSMKQEISILKAVRHPNICCLLDVYETKTELYLILELARGGELFEEIVKHGAYSERDASNIIRQIVKAISYLHEQGIAHRDIKPENILLAEPGNINHIKLADFGLAKILSSMTTHTPCGTPGYVAPEVLMMMGYGTAVDMWSIGVITYILLCGYPPFHDKLPARLYEKIKHAEFRFHDKYWSGISDMAKDFIRKLLVVAASDRLTASATLKHPWLHGLSTPSQPLPALFAQLQKFQAERKGKAIDGDTDTAAADNSSTTSAAAAIAAQLAGFLDSTPPATPTATADRPLATDTQTVISATTPLPAADDDSLVAGTRTTQSEPQSESQSEQRSAAGADAASGAVPPRPDSPAARVVTDVDTQVTSIHLVDDDQQPGGGQ